MKKRYERFENANRHNVHYCVPAPAGYVPTGAQLTVSGCEKRCEIRLESEEEAAEGLLIRASNEMLFHSRVKEYTPAAGETGRDENGADCCENAESVLRCKDKACVYVGDVDLILPASGNDREIFYPYTKQEDCSYFALPAERDSKTGEVKPCEQIRQLRKWVRKFKSGAGTDAFGLRFRIRPGKWPNIRITVPEYDYNDIYADAYEIHVTFTGDRADFSLTLPHGAIRVNAAEGVILSGAAAGAGGQAENAAGCIHTAFSKGENTLIIVTDSIATEVYYKDRVLAAKAVTRERGPAEFVDNSVSGNLEKCSIDQFDASTLILQNNTDKAKETEISLTVYGLHPLDYSGDVSDRLTEEFEDKMAKELPLFASPVFSLYPSGVQDRYYNLVPAYVLSENTVISPQRVLEEFEWRDTPWGDMTRVINRSDIWYADASFEKYPQLVTDCKPLAAAYKIGLDVFAKCTDRKCALPEQENMWSAGQFQGEGEGFGVWMRDSAHIAMRSGNLIDRETAYRTLSYTIQKGFDNGSDGPAMAIVGFWDYYLATGDLEDIALCMPKLKENIAIIDSRYDAGKQLVEAAQSTSNDAFPEPENGGYSLGTESYFMLAYKAMAEFGKLTGEDKENVSLWESRYETIAAMIRKEYWNDEQGFFTSGPRGTKAFEEGKWETSGVEAGIWEKFGIADARQVERVLTALEKKAMSPYGIILFPERPERNHFVGPIWGVWQAGFAAAAAASGNTDLILRLVSQQIRNCVLQKTFYEVSEADTGMSWRWPGQLWHAAGFVSLVLYGLFGISYDKDGMRIRPCVPAAFAGAKAGERGHGAETAETKGIGLTGLRFREGIYDITIVGAGTRFKMTVDGAETDLITGDRGGHSVLLTAILDGDR